MLTRFIVRPYAEKEKAGRPVYGRAPRVKSVEAAEAIVETVVMAQERILVVDDQRDELALLELRLKRRGYTPLLAGSAGRALELLEKGPVDLILCDYKMPRMDGLAFLAEVKSRYPGTPFVMMTGQGDMEKAMASLNKGAFDYIEKEFNMDDLFATIRRALDHRGRRT